MSKKKKNTAWESNLPNPKEREEPLNKAEMRFVIDKAAEKDSPA